MARSGFGRDEQPKDTPAAEGENGKGKHIRTREPIGEATGTASDVETRQELIAKAPPSNNVNSAIELGPAEQTASACETKHAVQNGSRRVNKRVVLRGLSLPRRQEQLASYRNSMSTLETPLGSVGFLGYTPCREEESTSGAADLRTSGQKIAHFEARGGGAEKIGWNHLGQNLTRLWNVVFLAANAFLFVYFMAPLLRAGLLNADKSNYYT